MNQLKVIYFIVTFSVLSWASVTDETWKSYKTKFNKIYDSKEAEKRARNVYNANIKNIHLHNIKYQNKKVSYNLAPNQFTDISIDEVQAMFPKVHDYKVNVRETSGFGFENSADITKNKDGIKVENQGLQCSSGWAYAAASSYESCLKIYDIGKKKSISVQQVIDCAGGAFGCFNQHQLTAYKYFADTKNQIFFADEYPNTPLDGQGACKKIKIKKRREYTCKSIVSHYTNDTASIKELVSSFETAVGIEFNEISFEFLHYSKGIFTPDPSRYGGSHFMAIVGYDKDYNGLEYWKVQNSFGLEWGECGYIRIPIGLINLGTYAFGMAEL